jgi:hypothetical protein
MGCPVCTSPAAEVEQHSSGDASVVNCPNCGNYTISRRAAVILKSILDTDRWKVAAWICENSPSIVRSGDIEEARNSTKPSLSHRADRMLRWLHVKFPPGQEFSINELGKWELHKNDPSDILFIVGGSLVSSPLAPVGWNRDIAEMTFMVTEVLCNEMGLLVSQNNNEYQVSPKGLLYLEGRTGQQASMGFCAMWFSDEVKPLWINVIEPAIRLAGYEPLRIDSRQHNGKIDDEIMASIRASRFVVADFTGNRGGVYYEAGFAHGLGLPVIFMCREGDDLHFDIRQYNCIFWKPDQLEDVQSRLKNRILATLGQGPLKVQ